MDTLADYLADIEFINVMADAFTDAGWFIQRDAYESLSYQRKPKRVVIKAIQPGCGQRHAVAQRGMESARMHAMRGEP